MIAALPLTEASAKVRTGPPIDDPSDLAFPIWAGVIPITLQFGAPTRDEHLRPGIPVPRFLAEYQRSRPHSQGQGSIRSHDD